MRLPRSGAVATSDLWTTFPLPRLCGQNVAVTASHREATRASAPTQAPRRPPPSPAAERQRSSRWRDPRLWLGLALVLVAMVAGARILGSSQDSSQVWRLSHDVPAGVLVTRADLQPAAVRFDDPGLGAQYLPVGQAATSGYATRDLHAGEMLDRSALTTKAAAAARQLPLDVPSSGQPVGLTVGDRVDVWAVPGTDAGGDTTLSGADAGKARPRLVLHDVAVLSIGSTESGVSAGRQVLVGVPPTARIASVLSGLNGTHVVLVRLGG